MCHCPGSPRDPGSARFSLDPFMGSDAAAAAMHGRDWLGIDVSREYCRMARLRVRALARGEAP